MQSDTESLFTYPSGLSFANFSVPKHIPVFLDQIDTDIRREAEKICGATDKIECIFDYIQTKNKEFALETQTTIEENDLKKRIGSESIRENYF